MTRPSPPSRYSHTGREPTVGGYGVVEVWHDAMLDRHVAIKWLNSPAGEEQLLNEWKMISRGMSKNVVEIYDLIFDQHGVLYGIVLEHVDGATLTSWRTPQNQNDLSATFKVLYQLACGLADLHAVSIVHRDIKPDNAIVDSAGRVKIVDFGLSSPLLTSTTLRARSTLGFAAPEFYSPHRPVVITQKADVYSFGLTCWKLITGGLPHVGAASIPEASAFPLASLSTASTLPLPPHLVACIDACLVWDPKARPDISAAADVLRRELTKGMHRGRMAVTKGVLELHAGKTSGGVKAAFGSMRIKYDGYDFSVESADGEVYVNNAAARPGNVLSEGCLLMFGTPSRGAGRVYAPFRIFTPEVVL